MFNSFICFLQSRVSHSVLLKTQWTHKFTLRKKRLMISFPNYRDYLFSLKFQNFAIKNSKEIRIILFNHFAHNHLFQFRIFSVKLSRPAHNTSHFLKSQAFHKSLLDSHQHHFDNNRGVFVWLVLFGFFLFVLPPGT